MEKPPLVAHPLAQAKQMGKLRRRRPPSPQCSVYVSPWVEPGERERLRPSPVAMLCLTTRFQKVSPPRVVQQICQLSTRQIWKVNMQYPFWALNFSGLGLTAPTNPTVSLDGFVIWPANASFLGYQNPFSSCSSGTSDYGPPISDYGHPPILDLPSSSAQLRRER